MSKSVVGGIMSVPFDAMAPAAVGAPEPPVSSGRFLPVRTFDEVKRAHPWHRQSTLSNVDGCPLSARFVFEGYAFDSAAQARGTLFHRAAAEIMRTMWTHQVEGEPSTMAVQDGLEVLYEVCAQRDVPDESVVWVPAIERRYLRKCLVHLLWDYSRGAPRPFDMSKVMIGEDGPTIEHRLFGKVRYPAFATCPECHGWREDRGLYRPDQQVVKDACETCGGSGRVLTGGSVERVVTGQPDVLLRDGVDGIRILDWKTSRQPPPKGNDERGHEDDADHISWEGYFQQRCYGWLAMLKYPWAQRVTLDEYYPLAGESRRSVLLRSRMEHVEREMATLVELTDRALMGGSESKLWQPQPSPTACAFCARPTRCPIEADVRALAHGNGDKGGGVAEDAQAFKLAREALVAQQVYKRIMATLKPWVKEHGPIRGSDRRRGAWQLDWKPSKDGESRSFVFHDQPSLPDEHDKPDGTLERIFREAGGTEAGGMRRRRPPRAPDPRVPPPDETAADDGAFRPALVPSEGLPVPPPAFIYDLADEPVRAEPGSVEEAILEHGFDPKYWPGWMCGCGRRNRAVRKVCRACKQPKEGEAA